MLVQKGNISSVRVPTFRRKSWRVEPHDSRELKVENNEPMSEDAYIETYHQLLAENAPSWVVPNSRRPTLVEKEDSSDESILSEALFHNSASKDIPRKKDPSSKSNSDSETSCKSTVTTSTSTEVGSSRSSYSRARRKALSRSMSYDARSGVNASHERKNTRLKSSWAEKKNPSPETSQCKPPALFTRDNPPPPPPRQRRRTFNLCPPPPPPPPAPLETARTTRVSSGESIASRHSRRFNFPDRRQRRVSFQDQHPTMKKQLCNSLTGPSLSGLKNMESCPKRLSISSTSAVAPKDENRPTITEEPRIRRPKQLSSSCNDASFSARPRRDNSIQEPLSSSMPDIISDIPVTANTTSFQDHGEITKSSGSIRRLGELSRSFSRLNINSQVTSEDEWSDIITSIEDKTIQCTPKVTSFYVKKEINATPAPHRRVVSEVVFDDRLHKKANDFHDGNVVDLSSNSRKFQEDLNDSGCVEPMSNTTMLKQDPCDGMRIDETPDEVLETKGKSTKDKLIDKMPLMKKVRSHRSGSIDENTSKAKNSLGLKYDKNGRCVKHPSIIVAKKRPFAKGWDLIKDCCPICAETDLEVSHAKINNLARDNEVPEERNRRKSRDGGRSVSIGVDELLAPSTKKYDWQLSNSFTSTKSNGSNEIMRIEGADSFLAKSNALRSAASLSEAASLAIYQDKPIELFAKCMSGSDWPRERKSSARSSSSSRNSSSRQLNNSGRSVSSRHLDYSARSDGPSACPRNLDYSTRSEGRTQLDSSRSEAHVRARSSRAIVSKMPYTTPWGEFGWYTGEVDGFRVPNGEGRMRFKSGQQHSGVWTSGYSEQFVGNSSRMKRGFGTNVAPWKEHSFQDLSYSGFSSNLMYKM